MTVSNSIHKCGSTELGATTVIQTYHLDLMEHGDVTHRDSIPRQIIHEASDKVEFPPNTNSNVTFLLH